MKPADNSENAYKEWHPASILNAEDTLVILILNQPLNNAAKYVIKQNWKDAVLRVAVDGGATQLKELSDSLNDESLIPDFISGDFDSITNDVLDFYRNKGVKIISTLDQDETDFTKAVRLILDHLNQEKIQVSSILAVVNNGNRMDHVLANLNTLYICARLTSIPIIILGHNSLTWLLTPRKHKIYISENLKNSKIGLIPLGKECTDVSTTGLKWNLSHDKMEFGNLISTSNVSDGSEFITVSANTELLWTMEFNLEL